MKIQYLYKYVTICNIFIYICYKNTFSQGALFVSTFRNKCGLIFLFFYSVFLRVRGGVFRQGLFHRLKQYKFETIFNFTHNRRRGVQASFLGCEVVGCCPLLDRMAKQCTLLLGSRMQIQFLNSEKKRLKNHLNLNFG